jgi:mannonate dehydratase
MAGLRITRVRPIRTAPERTRLVVVKVETSEPDLYGIGCATFTQRADAVVQVVNEYLDPFLRGRNPGDIEDIWQSVHVSSYWRNGPILHNALSGVDQALWDLKGKIAGLPVYELLGGRCRRAAPLYAHASGRDFAEVVENARRYIGEGYRYVRAQVAIPNSETYGAPSSDAVWFDGPAYRRITPRLFEHLRSQLGEEVELLHDVHERIAPPDTISLARDLEPYRLFFYEDPLAPEDVGWFRLLRQQSAIPIAMGELFVNPAEYLPLVAERLIDFIRVHVSTIGGITPARKLAAAGELFGVRTAWHGPGDVSPVGHAANLHLDLSSSNFGIQEQHIFSEQAREVFPGTPEVTDGMLWPNDRPGLGVDVDEAAAARYPYPEDDLHGSWTTVRRWDGGVVRP